jgi:hypothetical protein
MGGQSTETALRVSGLNAHKQLLLERWLLVPWPSCFRSKSSNQASSPHLASAQSAKRTLHTRDAVCVKGAEAAPAVGGHRVSDGLNGRAAATGPAASAGW